MNNWKSVRDAQYKDREVPLARELPIDDTVSSSDEHEAFIRHKQAMAQRWFGYYRKCKDQKRKLNLIEQYNKIAKSRD